MSNKICIETNTEDLNLNVFNMITEISESETLAKEQNVIQITGEITINVDVSVKEIMHVKKVMFGILLNVIMKMVNI